MRLIDADALIEQIHGEIVCIQRDTHMGNINDQIQSLQKAAAIIQEASTVYLTTPLPDGGKWGEWEWDSPGPGLGYAHASSQSSADFYEWLFRISGKKG